MTRTASTSSISPGGSRTSPIRTTSSRRFVATSRMFGFRNPKLFDLVDSADEETDLARRARLYQRASRMLMKSAVSFRTRTSGLRSACGRT